MATQPYTRIENALLNELCRLELTGYELRVVLLIIRYTKGFNRKSAKMSATFISNGTGINERSVKRILKNLAVKGLIKVEKKSKTATNYISLASDIRDTSTSDIGDTNTSDIGDTNTSDIRATQERKENKTPPSSASDERRRRLKEIMEQEWIPDEL